MTTQQIIDFERIKDANQYIHANYRSQPNLDEVVTHIHFVHTIFSGCSPTGQA